MKVKAVNLRCLSCILAFAGSAACAGNYDLSPATLTDYVSAFGSDDKTLTNTAVAGDSFVQQNSAGSPGLASQAGGASNFASIVQDGATATHVNNGFQSLGGSGGIMSYIQH